MTHFIYETEVSTIYLSKNAAVLWFLIVPHTDKIEWFELDEKMQKILNHQINVLSSYLKKRHEVEKVNVATIGNIVPQMHIHVVGRFKTDVYWPNVVWGQPALASSSRSSLKKYQASEIRVFRFEISEAMS